MKKLRPPSSRPAPPRISPADFLRLGMTLIELLVVISIMVLLFAALVPRVKPALDEARIREGARQLNAYLASAQALAAQRGLPVSVAFLRMQNNFNSCLQVQMIESPPIYAGETEGSLCAVSGAQVKFVPPLPNDPTVAQPGDLIRFNYRTTLYQVVAANLADQSNPQLTINLGGGLPIPPNNQALSYQIIRLPVRTTTGVYGSSIPPLQLPRGVCVDIAQSGAKGMTNEKFLPKDQFNPVVIFAPSGQVGLWYAATANTPVYVPLPSSLYFLVGKVEQVGDYQASGTPDPANPPKNDIDLTSRWVSIRARTGRTITFENANGATIADHRQYGISGAGMGAH